MPAERRPQCLTCNSRHREEIERRLLAGEPSRKISAWLRQTHGEAISHVGLVAHRNDHIKIAAEVRAEVEAQAERARTAGIKRRVADIEMLDAFARLAFRTARELAPKMLEPTMAQSTTYAAVLREGREMVKLRDEMLRDKKPTAEEPTGPRVTVAYAPGVAPLPDADSAQQAPEPGAPATPAGA